MDLPTLLVCVTESENMDIVRQKLQLSLKLPGFEKAIGCVLESEVFESLSRQMIHFLCSPTTDWYQEISNVVKSLPLSIEQKMEESLTPMDIYCFLNFIFGTMECVGARRELVLLRERIINDKENVLCFCSGSLCEGVAYPPSDDDILFYMVMARAVESYEDATQTKALLIVPSEYSAGYCLLSFIHVCGMNNTNCIAIINGRPFLSSTLFKESTRSHLPTDTRIHGPCLLVPLEEADQDLAFSIVCSSWPSAAKEWIQRDRYYGWPSPDIIQDIKKNGCHVVPIGDPYSNYRDHEWRMSFSKAERRLVHSFNHAQFLTYSLLRFALKMVIDKHFPDVLCSYFMKTTLFHTIERTPRQMWREDNLDICFIICLSILYNFIDYKNCPNYFIPKYNMIKRKVNDDNRQHLLDLIRSLIKERIRGVLLPFLITACFNKTWCFKFMESRLDTAFFNSYTLNSTINSFVNVDLSHVDDYYTYALRSLPNISQWRETPNELINIIWRIMVLRQCQISWNMLLMSGKQNKQSYILHKTIQSLFKRLIHRGDVSTGKLTVATYMFLVGKPRLALLVIQKLLSKYPPYAIERFADSFVKGYLDTMCLKGYTMAKKARDAWTPHFQLFYFDLDKFPLQMKILLSITDISYFHPLTYALVLENFCHLQLHNTSSLIKSTSKLLNHLDHLKDENDIAVAKLSIGIIKLIQGDNQSAYIWFGSVYMTTKHLYPEMKKIVSEVALMCIASLIYQQRFLPKSNWKIRS